MTNAQKERLIELFHKHHEKLEPEVVVADATPKNSVLHDLLTWDDKQAAHQFRIEEARSLIRRVIYVQGPSTVLQIRAPYFVRDPDLASREQGYTTTIALQNEPERARAAIRQELLRVQSSLERAMRVATALGMESEFETLLREVTTLRLKVDRAA